MKIWPSNPAQTLFRTAHQLRQRRSLRRFVSQRYASTFASLTASDIAIDCGANIGNITKMMANTGATVYAFEPNETAFAELRRRFSNHKNVFLHNTAVWDHNDNVQLYQHVDDHTNPLKWSVASSLLATKNNIDPTQSYTVPTIDLAAFILKLSKPVALVKIDVEGVEYDILNRLIETSAIQKIEKILVETHEHKLPELKEKARTCRSRIKALGLTNVDLNWK